MRPNPAPIRPVPAFPRSATLWLAGVLALAGCAQPAALAVNPNPPLPALPAETRPLPPISATPLVWQPAHYDWTGATYQYVAGRYIEQAGHSAWAPGFWTTQGETWLWVPAHWLP